MNVTLDWHSSFNGLKEHTFLCSVAICICLSLVSENKQVENILSLSMLKTGPAYRIYNDALYKQTQQAIIL